jgi:hypothetical protein
MVMWRPEGDLGGQAGAAAATTGITGRQKLDLLIGAMQALPPQEFAAKLATASILPIARQMIEKSFARKTFQVDRIDGPAAIYQTKRRQVAVVVSKYGATPTRIVSYPRVTVVPYYIMVKPEVELSDLLDAQFDAAADILTDAGAEMAVREDQEFLRLFDYVAPRTTTDPGNNTVVPTVSPGPGGVGQVLSSNVYAIGSTRAAPSDSGANTGDPLHADIMRAQALLRQISYEPDTILINPDGLGRLSAQRAFLYYLNFGTREVQEVGYARSMFGNRVIWSALVPQKSAFIFDTYELARLVEREALSVRPEFYELRARWVVYERVAPFIRNANALIRIDWFA